MYESIGQTPWLMDILWHLPASEAVHCLRRNAAELMRIRVRSKDVEIRDLSSYLVSHPFSSAFNTVF